MYTHKLKIHISYLLSNVSNLVKDEMTAIILFQGDYFSWNNTWFINIKLQFSIRDFYKVWCVGIQIYLHPSFFPSIRGWKHYGIRKNEIWLISKKIVLMQRYINRRIDYVLLIQCSQILCHHVFQYIEFQYRNQESSNHLRSQRVKE